MHRNLSGLLHKRERGEHIGDYEVLKHWYNKFHKLYVCYKRKHKRLKRQIMLIGGASAVSVIVGGVVGSITANPIVTGVVAGPGALIAWYLSSSKLNTKAEMCRFAYTTYKKHLQRMEEIASTGDYDLDMEINSMNMSDEVVTDLCPAVNGDSKKYDKEYPDGFLYGRAGPAKQHERGRGKRWRPEDYRDACPTEATPHGEWDSYQPPAAQDPSGGGETPRPPASAQEQG